MEIGEIGLRMVLEVMQRMAVAATVGVQDDK